jgi:carboxy-cis,cis-muconate cyclase
LSPAATSSYITIPPPYNFIYSVGGPTGEVHAFNTGISPVHSEQYPNSPSLFGLKVQDILFVPPEDLEKADKTRVALRYGSHGIELSSSGYAFIPVLGTDSIEMYRRELETGKLVYLSSNGSPRGEGAGDGPRHVKVHPNGKLVYCVTEHSAFLSALLSREVN